MKKENRELWEILKSYYNVKRFYNYMFTLDRISDEFKKEYVDRISAEFRRSEELGELDYSLFSLKSSEKLRLLIKQPSEYYSKYVMASKEMQKLTKENMKLKKKLRDIETSTTFKVGKIIMFIPIKIKRMIKKMLK